MNIVNGIRWCAASSTRFPRRSGGASTFVSHCGTSSGDAAHPMLIHAGQGVGQALEDGVAIAAILDGADTRSVEHRLRLFEDLRLKRATDVQALSRANAQYLHSEFPLKPGETRPDQQGNLDWILNYDVELEAERRVRDNPG